MSPAGVDQSPFGASRLAFPLALLLGLAASHVLIIHNDLGQHLRTGELILQSRRLPFTDPWSINTQGFPWLNTAWAWDCISWVLYEAFGLTGLLCVTAVLAGALVGLVASTSEAAGAKVVAAVPIGLWMLLALLVYELPEAPFSVSPQTTTLLLLAFLQQRLQRGGSRLPWWGPLLFVGWANLHNGFVAGQLAVAVALVERTLRFGKTGLVRDGALAGACLLAPLVSPNWVDNYANVFRHLSSPASEVILEWQPYSPSQSALASVFILGFLASLIHPGARRSVGLTVQALIWLGLGLQHQRNIALFLVSAAPIVAAGASSIFRTDMQPLVPRRAMAWVSALVVVAAPLIVMGQFSGAVEWPPQMYPKQEIAYLVEHLGGRRLYNHWNSGSFLIFEAAGKVPVFIDGRGATAYPPDLLEEMRDVPLLQILDRHKIDVALIPLYEKNLLATLDDGHSGWERELTGRSAVIYRRTAPLVSKYR